MEDVLEVWDLRKLQRTKTIDWEGTGQVLFDIDEEEEDDSDEQPWTEDQTEEEEKDPRAQTPSEQSQ